jgi:nucleotide-binding universal stress UspA family protein
VSLAPTKVRPGAARRSSGRPVVLATLGVPLDPKASAFAVDSAVETGRELVVVNVTKLEPLGLSMILGYDALPEFTPEVSESIQRSTELARSLGVRVERLRIRSPRPVTALLELVLERRPGLLVFGPKRSALRPRPYGRALAALRELTDCLVWVAPASPPASGDNG